MTTTHRLCSAIQHSFGQQPSGEWAETYIDVNTGATLFTQPIQPYKPTQTAPAQVGLENGWCVMESPTKTIEAEQAKTPIEEPQKSELATEAGMGTFFLLVITITGGIAVFQNYKKRLDRQFSESNGPMYLPNPWERKTPRKVPHGYGDYIEQEYPPMPEERLESVTLEQPSRDYLRQAVHGYMPKPPEPPQTSSQTTPKPELNLDLNQAQTTPKPELNLIQTTPKPELNQPKPSTKPELNQFPVFDPCEAESRGEFEAYKLLLALNQWTPKSKELLKVLWGANPNTKRYQPALERRNQFANRLEEYALNETE